VAPPVRGSEVAPELPIPAIAPRSSPLVCGELSVRLLALEISEDGSESYRVSFSPEPRAAFRSGVLRHVTGEFWNLTEDGPASWTRIPLGSPDAIFEAALGASEAVQTALAAKVAAAAPHWPSSVTTRLARRRLSGGGTVAFDARWFLSELATSAVDRPILFPDAAAKLGLAGLERASAIVRETAGGAAQLGAEGSNKLANTLLEALRAERASAGASHWAGEGRLIGEYASGELAQLGSDIVDGCRASIGTGRRRVVFNPEQPLGLSLGPLQPADASAVGDDPEHGSIGMGVDVGEVDVGGAADRAGVVAGMVLSRLSDPELVVCRDGRSRVPFETVLNEIDRRRAAGHVLCATFDSAAPVTRLYAVEIPADAALAALAAVAGGVAAEVAPIDVGVGSALAALCGGALLWREDTPRLFLGEAGSLTCAHTDICPQLELAHGLVGFKFLGVASHGGTPRLSAAHGGEEAGGEEAGDDPARGGDEATRVPTDRPLTPRQAHLLGDADLTLALLQEGDLAVFDSGALHFASNGADGPSAALYHGVITPAAVPRLRAAAAEAARSHAKSDGAYRNHLFAADLLRVVEPLLTRYQRARAAEP
jgi:hypothetical protein